MIRPGKNWIMKKIAGIILLILAIIILIISISKSLLPPALAGTGFIIIGLIYLIEKLKKCKITKKSRHYLSGLQYH